MGKYMPSEKNLYGVSWYRCAHLVQEIKKLSGFRQHGLCAFQCRTKDDCKEFLPGCYIVTKDKREFVGKTFREAMAILTIKRDELARKHPISRWDYIALRSRLEDFQKMGNSMPEHTAIAYNRNLRSWEVRLKSDQNIDMAYRVYVSSKKAALNFSPKNFERFDLLDPSIVHGGRAVKYKRSNVLVRQ